MEYLIQEFISYLEISSNRIFLSILDPTHFYFYLVCVYNINMQLWRGGNQSALSSYPFFHHIWVLCLFFYRVLEDILNNKYCFAEGVNSVYQQKCILETWNLYAYWRYSRSWVTFPCLWHWSRIASRLLHSLL